MPSKAATSASSSESTRPRLHSCLPEGAHQPLCNGFRVGFGNSSTRSLLSYSITGIDPRYLWQWLAAEVPL